MELQAAVLYWTHRELEVTQHKAKIMKMNESLTTFITMKTKHVGQRVWRCHWLPVRRPLKCQGTAPFLSPFSGLRSGFLLIFSFLGGLIPVCNFDL